MKTICSLVTKAPRLALVCLLVLFIEGATIVQAQERGQAGGYFMTIIPRGEFSENVGNNGYGGGGQFFIRVGDSPFLMGGDFGGVVYGSQSRREPISNTIPNLSLRVTTRNNIFLTHFALRAQPRSGPVRPYVDGLIGLKYLYTRTSVSDPFDDETIASNTDFSDTALSYGIGGGLQIPLTKGRESRIVLDTGVRYLRGGRADYLRRGSIVVDNGAVFFDIFSSRTDVLSVQVGVMFRF
jgi:opacity protein-like surface antigen